jgi:hypothetical protein
MGTECQKDLSDEDQALLDEAENATWGLPAGTIEAEMPAIEIASENRAVEFLRENIKAGLDSLPEDFFRASGKNNILKLDAEAIPTEPECRENYRLWQQVGAEGYEASNFPVIMGISDPATLERMPGTRDAVKEEMQLLYHSKLAPQYRDSSVADRILLVDRSAIHPEDGTSVGGATPTQAQLIADKSLPRVAHVFRDSDTGKMHTGQSRHRVVIHEIVHLDLNKGKNEYGEVSFRDIFHEKNREEWIAACRAQTEGQDAPGATPKSGFGQSADKPDEVRFLESDFICDHVACWDADVGVEICPEMQSFFDKYLT